MTDLDKSIVSPDMPAGTIEPKIPSYFEVTRRFIDMRIAMSMDESKTRYDWFHNQMGGKEGFNNLWDAMRETNQAKLEKLGHSNDSLAKLRGLMMADKYDPKAVEKEVTALVRARLPARDTTIATGSDGGPSKADMVQLNGIIARSDVKAPPPVTTAEAKPASTAPLKAKPDKVKPAAVHPKH